MNFLGGCGNEFLLIYNSWKSNFNTRMQALFSTFLGNRFKYMVLRHMNKWTFSHLISYIILQHESLKNCTLDILQKSIRSNYKIIAHRLKFHPTHSIFIKRQLKSAAHVCVRFATFCNTHSIKQDTESALKPTCTFAARQKCSFRHLT